MIEWSRADICSAVSCCLYWYSWRSSYRRGLYALFDRSLCRHRTAVHDRVGNRRRRYRSRGRRGFSLQDKPGQYLDILLDGRVVGRYMYAYDKSTRKRRAETYKPYLHVFDAEGKAPITKGPGGQDTHHRGIFIGWQQIVFQGKKYNLWEMKDGDNRPSEVLAPGGRPRSGDRSRP